MSVAFFQANFYQNNFYQVGVTPPVPPTPPTPPRPFPKLASFVFFESPGPSGVGPGPPRKQPRAKQASDATGEGYPKYKTYSRGSPSYRSHKKPPGWRKH